MRLFKPSFLPLCVLISALQGETKTVLSYLNEKPKHQFPNFSFVNPCAPRGGKLILSNQGTFDGLNLFSIKGSFPREVLPLCYQGLMYRSPDESFVLYPLLAKAYDLKDDYSSITFYIDGRAKFSDQTPVRASDIEATFKKLGATIPRYKNICSKIKSIKCIDDQTVQINFNPMPSGLYDAELPLVIAMIPILKAKSIENVDLKDPSFKPVIGSGPYVLDQFEQGKFVQLKKTPSYWAQDYYKGFHNFDVIRVDYYKSAQSQFQAFQSGAFDAYFETSPQNWRKMYNFSAVQTGEVVRVEKQHRRGVMSRFLIMNLKKPLFQDAALRKALFLANDPDSVNRLIYEGDMQIPHSTFANTIYAPSGKAEDLELKALEVFKDKIADRYDEIIAAPVTVPHNQSSSDHRRYIEEADKILTNAGYLLKDGVRLTKEGKPLQINFMTKDEKLEKIIPTFKKNLEKLGIQLIHQRFDASQYEGKVVARDFDMIIHAISNGSSPGIEQVYYYGSATADEPGSSNYIGVKDAVLDGLAKNIVTAKNKQEHIAYCKAMDRYFMHQYYFLPLVYDNKYRAAYWKKRFSIPEYDPAVGTDIIATGWSNKC
ncbi:MAG: hypothetical protein NEHIOOID_00829 [Holosporales bacterium]